MVRVCFTGIARIMEGSVFGKSDSLCCIGLVEVAHIIQIGPSNPGIICL